LLIKETLYTKEVITLFIVAQFL